MTIEFLIQDNQTGIVYDASQLLISATWAGELSGQPGRLTFDIVRDGSLRFYEGSPVRLRVDGEPVFFGWVFAKSRKDRDTATVTAYDQLRYLKNADTYVFSGLTVSDIFTRVCTDFQLAHRVVHPSSFVLPDKIHEDKTLFTMLEDAVDQTLIHTGRWFLVRDNFGTLELLDMAALKTDLILGDASLMTGYQYQTSIDDDTYNQVKLVQNTSGKREVYLVRDSETIDRWGLLQYHKVVDESANAAQIQEMAERLINLKNRVTRKLTLDCLGDWRVKPGNGVWVETAMDDMGISRYMIVHGCSHTVQNRLHTMKVTLEVVE